jgi:alkylation response protein AidB-like acyl-CoA dehydrogenase
MDFTFTTEQLAFREAIRKFLVVEAAPEMLRDIWETTRTGRSAELRAKLADQGLTALSVPEAHGGIGLGDVDWVQVHQELGYHGIPDSLTDTAYVAVGLINALPDAEAFKTKWLPLIAEGKARVAVGHPINPLVADAEAADLLLMWHDDEVHALTQADIAARLNASIDLSRRLYHVDWTPSDATRLCSAKIGKPLWDTLAQRASLAVAAQLLGLAQRMMDLGVDYAAQRKQFGKPIGTQQAVKHAMADIAVKIEFAEPVVYRAAASLARRDTNAGVHIAHARLATGEAAKLAARNSLQVHGAMGYTWEADLQMFMKRAWALEATWGNRAYQKAHVADHILADGAALGPQHTFN